MELSASLSAVRVWVSVLLRFHRPVGSPACRHLLHIAMMLTWVFLLLSPVGAAFGVERRPFNPGNFYQESLLRTLLRKERPSRAEIMKNDRCLGRGKACNPWSNGCCRGMECINYSGGFCVGAYDHDLCECQPASHRRLHKEPVWY